jgi:hypothetical protein
MHFRRPRSLVANQIWTSGPPWWLAPRPASTSYCFPLLKQKHYTSQSYSEGFLSNSTRFLMCYISYTVSCLYVMGHCLDTRVSTSIHMCFIELDWNLFNLPQSTLAHGLSVNVEVNLLSLVTSWLDNICQITTKSATRTFHPLFTN